MSEQTTFGPSLESVQLLVEDGSFEDSLAALESVVALLERGRLSIEESIHWYEAGLALSRRCSKLLDSAEMRIGTLEDSFGLPRQEDNAWDGEDNEIA